MNAFELLGYHYASAGGTCIYVARNSTQSDLEEGVTRIGGNPDDLLILGGDDPLPQLEAGQRAVIEGFSEFASQLEWSELKDWITSLRMQCYDTGASVLIMATAGLLDGETELRLRQLCDGCMELGFDRQGFALYPYLKVTKLRGVPDANRFLLFKETPKGLFMENTRRVF